MRRDSLENLFERYVSERDENAIAELVHRTRPRLVAAAKRICGADDADDCVQTAYLSLLHKRQGGMDAPVLPWLVTAVVRTAYRHKAQSKKQKDLAQRLSLSQQGSSPVDATRREEIKRIRDRVDQLPSSYRDPVVLHYLQGLSTEDAARLLEISRDALKKRLQRARAFLRSSWNPRILRLVFAAPWFLADAASAAAIGGLMTKKVTIAAALLAVALGTGALIAKRSQRAPSGHVAPRQARHEAPRDTETPDARKDSVEAVPEADRTGYFGVVVDEIGEPVDGALVELRKLFWRSQGREHVFHRDLKPLAHTSVRTDRRGRFRLEARWKNPEVVAAALHVVAEGHPRTIARAVRDAATRITLKPGGYLRVTLRDEQGAAVAGVEALLCEGKRQPQTYPRSKTAFIVKTTTDAAGAVVYHMAPGRYRVQVRAPGFVPLETDPIEIKAGSDQALGLVLERGSSLHVHVIDEEGRDIPGARVEARAPHHSGGIVTTDDRGRCRVGGLARPPPDGDYWRSRVFWHVEAKGFAASHGSRTLTKKPGREQLEVVLRRGVSVVVRVVDAAGRPLAGARITGSYDRNMANTIQRRFTAKTGVHGRADLPRMNPGKRVVGVYLHTYIRETLELEVGSEPIETEVTLTQAESSIKGVIQLPDGTHAAGGTIGFALDDSKQRALGMICVWPIGIDGSFEIKRAGAGVGRVFARVDGFVAQSWPLTVKPGELRTEAALRLSALDAITGRVADRGGRPLGGVTVTLNQQVKTLAGTTSHKAGFAKSQKDGSFAFRGVGAEQYWLRAHSKEWTLVRGGYSVKAGTRDLLVTMKPASEGSGIKLVVILLATPGAPAITRVQGQYLRNGRPHYMHPRKANANRLEFRVYDKPGVYDFTFTAPGFLPFVAKGIRIEDSPDNRPLEARFDRGAVLRVRVLDSNGAPLRREAIWCGNQLLRTDEDGECDVGGFAAGVRKIYVRLGSDRYTYARDHEVRVPGRAEITLRRYAHIWVNHAMTYGELRKSARWKLLDADGRVIDENVFDMSEIGLYARDRAISGVLRTTRAGEYRVVAQLDGLRAEQTITVRPGETTTIELNPR